MISREKVYKERPLHKEHEVKTTLAGMGHVDRRESSNHRIPAGRSRLASFGIRVEKRWSPARMKNWVFLVMV